MVQKLIKGIHHVSAITGNVKENYHFYTEILGMRLVKKTVNQDDTSMYHLFYADERGNPGTDLTFFEIPRAGKTYPGTNSISNTSLRVSNDEAIQFWKKRFEEFGVEHDTISRNNSRLTIFFRDFEGQRLSLVSDENNEGVSGGKPWDKSPIPIQYGIVGLGPITLTVSILGNTEKILTSVLGFKKVGENKLNVENVERDVHIFETAEGGTGAEVHVIEMKDQRRERAGRGSVHHVAFRVEDEKELNEWVNTLNELNIPNSGFVERYYFRSLYFREPNGILFELATDGPGFESDEDFEQLGGKLALPPYFENEREEIEANLEPLDTK
ncbi:ring-cleaving dioxygenase [Evansella sp. AB-P1]|uniref:ring-cleaving dioxygenase n=1 Tax=Evansella sp. AB-P1 TaxID=3037653 RepID=UPI00241FA423|nr:ring-cleaving dioxygenase [Evansella sp. AB-P1]MDG5789698.1 ring-cleaving dioxygenase [Evansella sp. AB-P1]